MLWYYLKFKKKKKNAESANPKVLKASNRRIRILSKCAMSNSEKQIFIKQQEGKADY